MTNKKVNSLQVSCLITFILVSTITGIGMTNIIKITGRDAYLSVLVAGILGIIPFTIILRVNDKDNDLTISEIVNKIFGKYLGLVVNLILDILVIIIGIVTMYSISNFIISQFLSDTPVMSINIVLGVVIWYGAIKGFEVVSRTGVILLIFTLILFIFSSGTLIPQIEIDNIKPFLEEGIGKPIQAGIILFLTNVVPILILLIIPRSKITDKEKYNKYLIIFYILGFSMAFITTFLTISIMGINLASIHQYPKYAVLKKISLFGFLDRIENIISIKWIFRCFMMLSVVVYYISNSIKKDNNSKILSFVIVTIIVVGSLWYFKNNTMFNEFILNKYPYINLVLFVLMTIIGVVWIIKRKKVRDN